MNTNRAQRLRQHFRLPEPIVYAIAEEDIPAGALVTINAETGLVRVHRAPTAPPIPGEIPLPEAYANELEDCEGAK